MPVLQAEWHLKDPNKPTKDGESKKFKKQIAALVSKELEAQAKKAQEEDAEVTDVESFIASVVKKCGEQSGSQQQVAAAATQNTNVPTRRVTLKSILKNAKNSQK